MVLAGEAPGTSSCSAGGMVEGWSGLARLTPSQCSHPTHPPIGRGRPGTSSDAGVEATRRLPTPAHGPLWVGPRALHAHVGTCGPPRARRVPISPLSWEFLLKAKQTKKVLVLPKFLAAAKWLSS